MKKKIPKKRIQQKNKQLCKTQDLDDSSNEYIYDITLNKCKIQTELYYNVDEIIIIYLYNGNKYELYDTGIITSKGNGFYNVKLMRLDEEEKSDVLAKT